ncbi:MAG: hypothetical protein ACOX6C_00045 [Patescibacteria group bacterium]|jgi:hypothetical protein
MFETSGDLLNLVIAFCVIVLTFFLCWALSYVIAATIKAKRVIDRAERIVTGAEGIAATVKKTLSDSSLYLKFFNLVAAQVLGFLKDRPFRRAAKEEKTSVKKSTTPKSTAKKLTVKKRTAKK